MVSVSTNQANIPATNFVAQGQGLKMPDKASSLELDSARRKSEKLLQKPKSNSEINDQVRSKPVFVNIMDFVKKNTARVMWGMGFGTASLGVLSYFLIGSKILSLFFAVPTLMAFFIGHNLGKNLIKGKSILFKNPLEQVEAYISNPQNLDVENVQALQTIDELKDLAKSKPEKREEIHSQLKRFKDIIQTKYNQVQYAVEGDGLRIKQDTERLLDAFNTIDSEIVQEENKPVDSKEE